jgi:hypothetical protein
MSQETAEQAVDAGFGVLMEHDPSGDWLNRMNLDTLRIASLENCVLGQLFGSYEVGLVQLQPELAGEWTGVPFYAVPHDLLVWAGDHGFAFGAGSIVSGELDAAWKAKITAARAER